MTMKLRPLLKKKNLIEDIKLKINWFVLLLGVIGFTAGAIIFSLILW